MPREQFNVRLPGSTLEDIDLISDTYGLTKTQVIILAVDRLASQFNPERVTQDDMISMIIAANRFPESEQE